jgi:flagellar motor switch protein FliM
LHDSEGGSFDQFLKMGQESPGLRRPGRADPYDFKQTEKFNQDQQKFLERIFSQFAENIVTLLAPMLQTRIAVELLHIRQRQYHAYLNSLQDPTTLIVFKIDPETKGFVAVDFDLSFALLDRLMGGKGQPLEEVRYFTDLEKAVLQRPLLKFLDGYGEAWREIQTFKLQYDNMEFNPLAVHIVPPSENMVVVSFQAQFAQAQGSIEIAVPFRHLKGIIPRASFEEFMLTRSTQTMMQAPPAVPLFAKNLEAARVPISVELGKSEVLFQDLLNLEIGDRIKLEMDIKEPLRIKVNDKTKFLGYPGRTPDGKMAIRITKVLSEGDEEFEE